MSAKDDSQNHAERIGRLPQGAGIEWDTRRKFRLAGYRFHMPLSLDRLSRSGKNEKNYADNVFFLLKSPDIIARYLGLLREAKLKNVVQLGVFRGGSVAFLQLLARPERLLAMELHPERQVFLDRFIDHEGLGESVRVEYGIDQADTENVARLVRETMGRGRQIDYVFDDASHMLTPTRSSFETLFPLIRPGGAYIVEDYAAAQLVVGGFQQAASGSDSDREVFNHLLAHSLQADHQPVHLLAVEAMLASINDPGIVRRVVVDRQWLKIVRGVREIDPAEGFDLRRLANDRFGLLDSSPDAEFKTYLDANSRSG
ncbi:MAG: class I SAM-dependent methyltransferase [Halioglobus sp.]|nr:class I SAM-dependent methyltransferase [Halioglobus sp.]